MPKSISQVAVSPEMFDKIEGSYSADRISEGTAVRKPVEVEGKLYLATGSGMGKVEAYQLIPREEFTGGVRTYKVPPGREYDEYYESLRNDPNGFYHGMLVKRGAHEHALVGPPIIFVVKATKKNTNRALVTHSVALKILGPSFELHPTGLTVIGKPTEEEYEEAFRRLSLIEDSQAWWWGDLANAQEKHYGYVQEFCERYERNWATITTYQSVCNHYEPLNRFKGLSFKHHMVAAPLDDRLEWLKKAEFGWSAAELAKQIRLAKILPPSFDGVLPTISHADYRNWLPQQPNCDLLLTDPPYSTEVKDIQSFAQDWLPLALVKIKPTGRAYIFIGAYPKELQAYLRINTGNMTLANIMVWEYQNAIGPASKLDYNLNWQALLYYRGPDAPELDCPILTEQFAVQEVNAPDGRTGIRYNEWQKPDELAERLIRHSTKPDHLVLDCFAGTGTFLLAAAKFKRVARGCDISKDMIEIAIKRGCEFVQL